MAVSLHTWPPASTNLCRRGRQCTFCFAAPQSIESTVAAVAYVVRTEQEKCVCGWWVRGRSGGDGRGGCWCCALWRWKHHKQPCSACLCVRARTTHERADRGFSLFSQPDFSQFSACFPSHVLQKSLVIDRFRSLSGTKLHCVSSCSTECVRSSKLLLIFAECRTSLVFVFNLFTVHSTTFCPFYSQHQI